MEATALKRLKKERIDWRAEHPPGFYARLKKNKDGTHDYFNWECGIPGPKGTPWEGGLYKINLKFPEDYPVLPPKCVFEKKLFHPNVYPSGAVCLSIINDEEDWRAGLKVKDILLGIQDLLANPNTKSPAQKEAFESYNKKSDEYRRKVREQAKECIPKLEDFKRHLNKNDKEKEKEKEGNKNNTNDNNNIISNNNTTTSNTENNNSNSINGENATNKGNNDTASNSNTNSNANVNANDNNTNNSSNNNNNNNSNNK